MQVICKMLFSIIILVCVFEDAVSQSSRDLIPFEPIQYVKFQNSPVNESSIWNTLYEANPQQIGEIAFSLKKRLHDFLHKSDTSVVFAKGERIISKRLSSKKNINKREKFPHANLVSLLGVSLTILLENYQSKLINKPIGEILKEKDLANPVVKGYESLTFLDLLNMLSSDQTGASILDSESVVRSLNKNGEVALYFINSILGNTANDAWMDALLAFDVENHLMDSDQLKLSLRDVFQYALTVIHDFRTMAKATEINNVPLQDQRYLFGWWLNCPRTRSDCIFPDLPEDLLFSLSPALRIYISPHFELSVIVSQSGSMSHFKTFNDVITKDKNIWKQIYSALDQSTESTMALDSETIDVTPKSSDVNGVFVDIIHKAWPVVVFLFWVISSHIWVYWMFYCFWIVATKMSKRTHVLRPKTAASSN